MFPCFCLSSSCYGYLSFSASALNMHKVLRRTRFLSTGFFRYKAALNAAFQPLAMRFEEMLGCPGNGRDAVRKTLHGGIPMQHWKKS